MQVSGVAEREWIRIVEYQCGGAIVDGEEKPARVEEGTYMVARKGQSPSEMKGDIDKGRATSRIFVHGSFHSLEYWSVIHLTSTGSNTSL